MSTLSQLKRALPKNTVISGSENTRPFECDGLSVYKQEPLAVVLPNNIAQIKKVLEICRKNNTPIVTRGAGTGLFRRCNATGRLCSFRTFKTYSNYFN